jgi:hypothetical protein
MSLHRLISAATACIGALAIAAPVASAANTPVSGGIAGPWSNPVCMQVALEGPWAALGPYGVLGDYGPLGSKAGQPNPAAGCYSGSGFGMSGVGMPGVGMPGSGSAGFGAAGFGLP